MSWRQDNLVLEADFARLFKGTSPAKLSQDRRTIHSGAPPVIFAAKKKNNQGLAGSDQNIDNVNGDTSQGGQPEDLQNDTEDTEDSYSQESSADTFEDGQEYIYGSTFSITYNPNGSSDKFGQLCSTFPEAAKAAFDAATTIWSSLLQSDVPITIKACWANLGSSSILGYSGGGSLHRDFTNAPLSNTWYSGSLANALAGSDLATNNEDMHITYNSNFSWYYGIDGNTPSDRYDLMTVVLHEIGHGLNFSGSMSYSGGIGYWGYSTGYPNVYDTYVKNGSGIDLLDYVSGTTALGTQLVSGNLWFHGDNAVAANSNSPVRLYAPSTWASGSGYSHLDYVTYNNTSNQLMVYAISAGEAIHDPGAITKGLFKDLGWQQPLMTFTLTVNSIGTAGVPITANPDVYSGITNYSMSSIPSGTAITLTAPDTYSGARYTNWIACDKLIDTKCTVVMDADKTITVNYIVSPAWLPPILSIILDED